MNYNFINMILSIICILVTAAIACYIPRRILTNQIFADLVAEYRKADVGMAVLAIFDFYKNDCAGDVSNIHNMYVQKYKTQIETPLANGVAPDYDNALHFQRRFLSQFYADIAKLRFDRCPRLRKKDLKYWFTPNETTLLSLLLHMAKPAEAVFIKVGIPEPPQSDVPMNKLLLKLYDEVKKLK